MKPPLKYIVFLWIFARYVFVCLFMLTLLCRRRTVSQNHAFLRWISSFGGKSNWRRCLTIKCSSCRLHRSWPRNRPPRKSGRLCNGRGWQPRRLKCPLCNLHPLEIIAHLKVWHTQHKVTRKSLHLLSSLCEGSVLTEKPNGYVCVRGNKAVLDALKWCGLNAK